MKRISSIILILFCGPILLAASNSSSSVQLTDTGGKVASKKWSILASTTIATDSSPLSVETKTLSSSYDVSLGYKLPYQVTSTLSLSLSKDLKDYREEKLNNASLSFSRPIKQYSRDLSLSAASSFTIPLGDARKSSGIITAVNLGPTLVYDASAILFKDLILIYSPRFRRYFHEYKTATSGTSNTQYRLANTLIMSYQINDKFSAYFVNSYYRNFTYGGNTNDIFIFDQSVSYEVGHGLGIGLGHSIADSALAANGQDSNVKIFDRNISTYYLNFRFHY